MLTRDDGLGLPIYLGRDPENEAIVKASAAALRDGSACRNALLQSAEFARIRIQSERPCWVAPPVFDGTR